MRYTFRATRARASSASTMASGNDTSHPIRSEQHTGLLMQDITMDTMTQRGKGDFRTDTLTRRKDTHVHSNPNPHQASHRIDGAPVGVSFHCPIRPEYQ